MSSGVDSWLNALCISENNFNLIICYAFILNFWFYLDLFMNKQEVKLNSQKFWE